MFALKRHANKDVVTPCFVPVVNTRKDHREVVVAFLKRPVDLLIARDRHWYRIPESTKIIPQCIREGRIKTIAFYQPKSFGKRAFKIEFFAECSGVTVLKRRELLPDEPNHPNAENEYFKIEIGELLPLPNPILSHNPRRILFIPTTRERLFAATEINDVFHESLLEERMWNALRLRNIPAERQYYEEVDDRTHYIIDFAIFCNNGKIAVECDGDFYHDAPEKVHRDKERSIALEALGWSVLPFTQDMVEKRLEKSVYLISKNIKRLGYLAESAPGYGGMNLENDEQLPLF